MMLCAKNYCNLLIFGRVIVKIKRGSFLRHSVVDTDYLLSDVFGNAMHSERL